MSSLSRRSAFNVLDAVPADDGILVTRQGANTLVVVRTPILDDLRRQLTGRFGAATYDALHPNSAAARGAGSLDEAFRRQFRLDAAIVEEAHAIPEVAYLHGPRPARLSQESRGGSSRESCS